MSTEDVFTLALIFASFSFQFGGVHPTGGLAKNREAPVLVVIGADGKQEMVNYRVKDDMYIVDRLFEKAELILGSGKKARKVEIDRERKS